MSKPPSSCNWTRTCMPACLTPSWRSMRESNICCSTAGVTVDQVQGLVHGSMFTRGPQDLKSTAIFVGGTDVAAAEELLRRVLKSFFGPLRVSVMMDANGANTTAAAAVLAAGRHVKLQNATAVGAGRHGSGGPARRAAAGSRGGACPRRLARPVAGRTSLRSGARAGRRRRFGALATTRESMAAALEGVSIVISAGAAGVDAAAGRRVAEVLHAAQSPST